MKVSIRDRWQAAHRSGRAVAISGLLILLWIPAVSAQQQRRPDGVVAGRVLDQATGAAVAGAEVALDDDGMVVTDAQGTFTIRDVSAGTHLLRVSRLGFGERTDTIHVPEHALVNVTVSIAAEAIPLEPIVVDIRSAVLARTGFYERKDQGYGGHFMDRVQIEDKNPSAVTDLFSDVPGVRVMWGGLYGRRVFMNQRNTFADDGMPGCEPMVWLDGIRSTMNSYDLMRAEEIEGVEVYVGANAPGKYVSICGTVVIWTRVPIR